MKVSILNLNDYSIFNQNIIYEVQSFIKYNHSADIAEFTINTK